MKVTLNIAEDAELRACIKEAIKGQVMSIAREEFLNIFRDELTRKIKGTDSPAFEGMMKKAMTDVIEKILRKDLNIGGWDKDFVKPAVEEIVNKAIKGIHWDTIVNDLAKKKVQDLVK